MNRLIIAALMALAAWQFSGIITERMTEATSRLVQAVESVR